MNSVAQLFPTASVGTIASLNTLLSPLPTFCLSVKVPAISSIPSCFVISVTVNSHRYFPAQPRSLIKQDFLSSKVEV